MKSPLYYFAATLLVVSACQSVDLQESTVSDQPFFERDFVPGALNVLVTETLAEEIEKEGTVSGLPGSSAVRLFQDGGRYEERMRREGLHLWYKIKFDEKTPLTKASNELSSVEGIEFVEFRPRLSVNDEAFPFNDPDLSKQWHYSNPGSIYSGLVPGCDINVIPAWERGIVGSDKVIVAVIDAGVDYDHEDLHDNMWTNPETEPIVSYGYNFDAGSHFVTPGDHGTHVAGTISAINNNGIGVSGIAGGDAARGIKGVRIMSCQIFSSLINGEGDAEGAIVWAANHGAVIAQNSWGYDLSKSPDMEDTPRSLKVAIDYFNTYAGCDNYGNQLPDSPMKGGVVIFSAGNDGIDRGFPASYEGCIAVGSVAGDYKPAYYSNFGDWVDIAAPGGDSSKSQEVTSTLIGNRYGRMQGTSMACPHVSGVAALIVSEFGGPEFTREMCIERLLKTVTPLNPNFKLGSGIVNAADAVAHYGEYLPNNAEFAGYESLSTTSLTLKFIVPEMSCDVRCRNLKLFINEREFTQPLDKFITVELASYNVGDTVSAVIDNLEAGSDYYVSTVGMDAMGNETAMSENYAVKTISNNPPVIFPLQNLEFSMKRFTTKTLEFRIFDPDNDLKEVSYLAAGEADTFTETGDLYIVTIEGPKAEPGDYTSTVRATDGSGNSVETTIHFTIEENRSPAVTNIGNQVIIGSGNSVEIDLKEYFSHPDGDTLIFTATVSDDSVISQSISEGSGKMTVRSRRFGYSDVTVIAADSFGLTAQCSFKVAAMSVLGYEVYPNPVTDGKLFIRSALEGRFSLSVINANGATVKAGKDIVNNPFNPYCMDVSDVSAGTYTVNVKGVNGNSSYKVAIY